jgi:mono/diheme cytochrome c family protein
MRYKRDFCLILAAAVLLPALFAQTTVKRVPARPTVSIAGKDLYREYCAVCHGADGKGAGPAAEALKKSPTDLTQMARRHEGRFPETDVLKTLTGERSITAHGSSDMPVWGAVFRNMSSNPGLTQSRIHALLQYVEEMQAK